MKTLLKETLPGVLFLLSLSLATSLGFHWMSGAAPLFQKYEPPLPPGVEEITVEEAVAKWRQAAFVDARERVAFERERVALAVSVPVEQEVVPREILERLQQADEVIVYCDGPDCRASAKVAARLAKEQVGNIKIMKEGYPAWRERGYPMVFPGSDAPPPPPPRRN